MRVKVATAICLLGLLSITAAASAGQIDSLKSKVESAKTEAGEIAGQLKAAQGELAAAQEGAARAGAREEELSGLLAEGERHAAELAGEVADSKRRLATEKRRLERAEAALGARLVAIYESGMPDEATLILGSGDFNELTTRANYLDEVQRSDTALAARVEEVRDSVRGELDRATALKAKADAYNERLVAARGEIASVRGRAETAAARLDSVTAARSATLASLESKIGGWVGDIEAAEAASREAAEEEVGRWLGGPFTIPSYIVMCESGGDYGAVNPSSGAGGAYQILPSTWELYGGQGEPQDAPKSEQDAIAAEIWADSGPGAWVCAG